MMNSSDETWQEQSYPDRYYAFSNTDVLLGGYPAAVWVDVDVFTTKPAWLPPASDMIALTEDAWNSRNLIDQIIKDGKVQTYTAPTETVETAATSSPAS